MKLPKNHHKSLTLTAMLAVLIAYSWAGMGCSEDTTGGFASSVVSPDGGAAESAAKLDPSNYTYRFRAYDYDNNLSLNPSLFAEPGGVRATRDRYFQVYLYRHGVPVTLSPDKVQLALGTPDQDDVCGHTHYRDAYYTDYQGLYEFRYAAYLRLPGGLGEFDYYVRVDEGPMWVDVEPHHVSEGDVQGRITWRNPDFNGDGIVNQSDAGFFTQYLGTQDPRADLSCDGNVNLSDAGYMSTTLGHSCFY